MTAPSQPRPALVLSPGQGREFLQLMPLALPISLG